MITEQDIKNDADAYVWTGNEKEQSALVQQLIRIICNGTRQMHVNAIPSLPQSQIINLVNDLASKANSVHTHPQSDTANLVTDLAAKESSLPSKTGNALKYLQVNVGENGFQYGTPNTTVRITSDVTNSTTTLADATSLSFSLTANQFYEFKFYVIFQTAATIAGIRLALNSPANNFLHAHVITPTSLTAITFSIQRAVNGGAATNAIDTANTNTLAIIEGIINPTANGTLIVRFASERASSNAVIKAGSCGILTTIA